MVIDMNVATRVSQVISKAVGVKILCTMWCVASVEQHMNAVYLPKYNKEKPLYIGFFNTGAYQETIGGFGGLKHCLIPEPKHILIQRDDDGKLQTSLFSEEQTAADYLRILGYNSDQI